MTANLSVALKYRLCFTRRRKLTLVPIAARRAYR